MTTREIRNLNTDDLISVIRRAAYGETVYAGTAIIHKDDNTGYAVASMLTSLSVADRSVIEDAVNRGVRSIEQRGAYPEKSFVFDIPADDEGKAGYHGRLLAIVELYTHEPMTAELNKNCRTQVLVRLTQANPDKQLIKMIQLNLEELCDEVLSRERSIEHSLNLLAWLLRNAWELYRSEWNRAVERHDRDAYPDPCPF